MTIMRRLVIALACFQGIVAVHGGNEESELELAQTVLYFKDVTAHETPYDLTDGGAPFYKVYHSTNFKIYIWNMKIKDFTITISKIYKNPGEAKSFKMVMDGISLTMDLNWRTEAKTDPKLEESGTISILVRGVSMEILGVVAKVNGRKVVGVTSCDAKVQEFLPQFKKKNDLLKNAMKRLKKDLQLKLCKETATIILENLGIKK